MKKQYILLVALIAVIAGLLVASVIKYENTPKGLSLQQAVSQRNTAERDVQIQKSLNTNDQARATSQINNLTGQVTALTTQKTTLCAQIVKAKLVQPICQ
jgi:predicted histidine transporter YuiF (NhaC family)